MGVRVFLASSIVAQVCALVRYVLLARLLGPEQLGWAATLILTAQFFDSVTNTGGDRFLIQNRDGDLPAVQRLVHLSAIVRGTLTAAALVACAIPIANFFGQRGLAPALMALALAPFLLGFMHLDLRRMQRHNDFRAEGWATLVAELVSLVVTAAAAWWIRDYTASLYGLVARAAALVVVSHLCAERRFAVGIARDHLRALTLFATPLMASGLLMFIGSQGDRVLVGVLGPAALGQYSAVLLLILYPSAMVQRYVSGMYLPLIAAERQGADRSAARPATRSDTRTAADDVLAAETILLALAMAAGFAAIAPAATVILYGPAFRQDALLVALIGLLQVYRFIRLWPTTEGLALGRSGVPLIGNLVRVAGLPVALLAMNAGQGLAVVVGCLIGGELVALVIAAGLVNRARGRPVSHNVDRIALFVAISTLVAAAAGLATAHRWAELAVAVAAGLALTGWFVLREAGAIGQSHLSVSRLRRPPRPA